MSINKSKRGERQETKNLNRFVLLNNSKRGIEFSFAWLFAIIVGAMILFLAIYAAMGFIESSQDIEGTKAAKELTIIFNPLETGLASGKSSIVNLNPEARIYNKCSVEESFGKQKFSISQKSGFKKEWPLPGGEISVYNKYVFSDEIEQGSKIYFFSKPFNMPFKVSELIFMSTKNYCFKDAPEFIRDEIIQLQIGNVKLENCSSKEIQVCFGSSGAGCNISVYGDCSGNCNSISGEYEFGHTVKNGKTVYHISSLIYGTIFSSVDIYNCNFKRLMMRIKQICYLYENEANFLAARGCGNAIITNLIGLANTAENAKSISSSSILMLKEAKDNLDLQNSKQLGCGIY